MPSNKLMGTVCGVLLTCPVSIKFNMIQFQIKFLNLIKIHGKYTFNSLNVSVYCVTTLQATVSYITLA